MNILQKIFKEHYEEIEYILHPRPIVMENIEKMINCGNSSYGGAMYGCPHCGQLKFVPFRCHSKFCPTCGNKYSIDRSTRMSFKLIDCTHRHLVFTIDQDLRPFYLYFYSCQPQTYNFLSSSIIAGRFLYFTFQSATICSTTFDPPFIFCILLSSDTKEE